MAIFKFTITDTNGGPSVGKYTYDADKKQATKGRAVTDISGCSIEVVGSDSMSNAGKTGLAAAGGMLLFGPLGAIAGGSLKARGGKAISAAVTLRDGAKFLADIPSTMLLDIQGRMAIGTMDIAWEKPVQRLGIATKVFIVASVPALLWVLRLAL